MSFLFGSSKTESSVPEWLEQPAREMLQRSIDMGKTGYMPYAGPQVAALDPAQIASMQNTNAAAGAFGLNQAMPNVPQATDFGGGMMGYSSMPLYQQQQDWMAQNRPGQKSFYDSFFVDPYTGGEGSRMNTGAAPTGNILDMITPEQARQINEFGFPVNDRPVGDYGGRSDAGYGSAFGGDGLASASDVAGGFFGGLFS